MHSFLKFLIDPLGLIKTHNEWYLIRVISLNTPLIQFFYQFSFEDIFWLEHAQCIHNFYETHDRSVSCMSLSKY